MRKIVLIALFAVILTVSAQVNAQTATPSPADTAETTMVTSPSPTRKPTTRPSPNLLRNTTTATREGTFKVRREAAKEKFMEQRDAFKEKMLAIKDTRKQAILERLDERISNLNDNHVEKLETHLTRLTAVLEKIKTKVEAAKEDDKDVKLMETAIEEAEKAIEDAQTAIDTQVEKDYVITFDSETQIKSEATKVTTTFKMDIRNVHEAVKKAHKEVVEAAQSLGTDEVKPTGSSSTSDSMSDDESTGEAKITPKL